MVKPKYQVPYKDRVGLIDGDIIVYNSAFAGMRNELPLNETIFLMEEMLLNIRHMLDLSDCTIYLSDSAEHNFRYKEAVTQPYKGNRTQDKPDFYQELKDHLFKHWDAVLAKGMEADDYMGLNQTDTTVIVTVDKDLDQIAGWHYNFKKMKLYYVTPEEAIHYFFIQMLTGDRTDNIKGIHRCGPVTAYKLLADCKTVKEMYSVCMSEYKREFKDKALARWKENKQLIMIKGMPLDVSKKKKKSA